MNIRKLEVLSKDELIDLIKQEREACGQLVPISVEEQLPERSKESSVCSDKVIAYTKDGNQLMAFYDHDHKEWEDVECIKLDDVTHWMPLPDPPTDE